MIQIFHLFCLRLLFCRAGAHVHTVCENQRAVLFPCSVCLSLCQALRLSIVRTYENKQSENKTDATWERAATASFSHFFLLNDFSPLSRSLEQAMYVSGRSLAFSNKMKKKILVRV